MFTTAQTLLLMLAFLAMAIGVGIAAYYAASAVALERGTPRSFAKRQLFYWPACALGVLIFTVAALLFIVLLLS